MRRISKRRKEMGEEAWSKYQSDRNSRKSAIWAARNVNSVVEWRQRTKQKLIAYKGR